MSVNEEERNSATHTSSKRIHERKSSSLGASEISEKHGCPRAALEQRCGVVGTTGTASKDVRVQKGGASLRPPCVTLFSRSSQSHQLGVATTSHPVTYTCRTIYMWHLIVNFRTFQFLQQVSW